MSGLCSGMARMVGLIGTSTLSRKRRGFDAGCTCRAVESLAVWVLSSEFEFDYGVGYSDESWASESSLSEKPVNSMALISLFCLHHPRPLLEDHAHRERVLHHCVESNPGVSLSIGPTSSGRDESWDKIQSGVSSIVNHCRFKSKSDLT
jgi:hypothetical protein